MTLLTIIIFICLILLISQEQNIQTWRQIKYMQTSFMNVDLL